MHSLTICFGPTGTIWTLLFKTEEKAAELYSSYLSCKAVGDGARGTLLASTDDFGQAFAVDLDLINGVMLENMDESQMAQIERGLHQARTQAKAETRAMSDEVIKGAMRAKQMGPAVMSPVPGGRFNG